MLFQVRLVVGPVGPEVRIRVTTLAHFPVRASRGAAVSIGMNALRRPEARHAAILSVNLPASIFLHQEMVSTATAQASTTVAHIDQRSCPVSVEAHGGNVEDHKKIEGKASGNTRSLLNRFHVRGSD
jgi:hypothetical protein